MSEIHSEQTLKDKPDCGVIDPAWCEADDEGQLFSIPCKRNATVHALEIHMDCNFIIVSYKMRSSENFIC